MKHSLFLVPVAALLFVVGCSNSFEVKPPAAPSSPSSQPYVAPPAATTCIGDQCGGGSAAPQPAPTGTPGVAPSPVSSFNFYAEVEGLKRPVTTGMTLEVQYPRMTGLYNAAAKPDCSNVKVDGLIAKPGPVCVVWADSVALNMKKGDSKSVRWGVDSSEVQFTLAVK